MEAAALKEQLERVAAAAAAKQPDIGTGAEGNAEEMEPGEAAARVEPE